MPFASDWNTLDRQSHFRHDTARLLELQQNPDTRYVLFNELKFLTKPADLPAAGSADSSPTLSVAWQSCTDLQPLLTPTDATASPLLVFLGSDSAHTYFALNTPPTTPAPASSTWTPARPALFQLPSSEASVVSVGRAIIDWNLRNGFCSTCGSRTITAEAGWKRECTNDECGSRKGVHNVSYPRTDAVVIACVVSKNGERCLLGRQKTWASKVYSCIAGFVEPAETVEAAVRREVLEEAGVIVGKVRFMYSQPWPYPSQLMLGCLAYAESDDIHLRDQELEDAKWFTLDQVRDALGKSSLTTNVIRGEGPRAVTPDGEGVELKLPPPFAVANWLVSAWVREKEAEVTGDSRL